MFDTLPARVYRRGSAHPRLLENVQATLPTMSISVDDLVASMSSNHIGQEAMDLAALQVSSLHALR